MTARERLPLAARSALPLLAACALQAQETLPAPSAGLGLIRCTAAATAPIVRIEGTSELLGDILITCRNSGPPVSGQPRAFVDADVELSLNVEIGNRVGPGGVADAVLVVNGKDCPPGGLKRTFDGCPGENPTVQDPMLARRDPARPGVLVWRGVALPVPGAAIDGGPVQDCAGRYGRPDGCHPRATTVRLTNVRANASRLGASGEPAAASIPIDASLSVRAAGATVYVESGPLRAAEAASGLLVAARTTAPARLCSHGESVSEVTVSEGFASAFKERGKPSLRPGIPGWEERYYPLVAGDSEAALALAGTRIRVSLSGLPERLSVSAPTRVACAAGGGPGTSELRLVDGATAEGLGGTVIQGQAAERSLRVSEEFATAAVYEVTRADPLAREACSIPFRFSRAGVTSPVALGGTVTVSANLAPVEFPAEGARGDYAARFAEVRPRSRPEIALSDCGTTLFFPFVTNRTNFDTAIVIANTSADPLRSRHQSGQCILRYHGSGISGQAEPAIQRSAVVEPGRQLAFTISNGSPAQGLEPLVDFQGYLVAECGFQHAHGFVFVTEQVNGAAILAQGYLAEIVRGAAAAGVAASPP